MTRNTYVLLGLLAVLIIIAYFVMQKPGERSSTGENSEMLASVDSIALDRIEIKSPTASVVLEKKGVEWFVESPVSYKADQSNVATLIHSARTLRIDNIVSNKPDKHAVFQVDTATGTLVRLMQGGAEKGAFILGKAGSSYSDMYARRAASNEVALVSGASSFVFNRPVKEWRDRTILSVPKETIKEVRYQYGDTTFVLAFRDGAWTIGRDSTQEGVVSSLLSSLSNIQADDFVDSLTTHPTKPTAQISFAGTQLTFFYVKGNEKYFVRSSASPQWFEMQNWHANQILMRKKDILKSPK
ncbi:MAG: DUF4340 domain-containing protein [Ignavibacteriales bacterium]|nr:DUF4340 domain-containing protein [Ignavibacteriales bacterium]